MLALEQKIRYNSLKVRRKERFMHFLLTNDDGIDAIGLKALSAAITQAGHTVTVCAPQSQQSAASHHLTLNAPLMVQEVPWEGGEAYALGGTPADCARIGKLLSGRPIDFAFSGINNGENAGTAIFYSGTVSAAREARMCGLPAMAVSIMTGADWNTLLRLGRMAVDIAEKTDGKELPRLSILNLNAPAIPADQWKPLRLAPLSDACYLDSYERRVSPRGQSYFWLEAGLKIEPHRPGTDMALLNDGCPVLSLVGPYLEENGWIRENLQELIH